MVRLVCARTSLTRNQAYMLCSLAGNLRITQTVDGNKGVHMLMPKAALMSKAALASPSLGAASGPV
jgi:acetamidase/formamidase